MTTTTTKQQQRPLRTSLLFAAAASTALLGDRLLASSSSASYSTSSCVVEEGYDYYGGDVGYYVTVDSAAACCDVCSSNSTCSYFSFQTDSKACLFKNSRADRRANSKRVSGYSASYSCELDSGYDYYGYDLVDPTPSTTSASSAEQCCSLCNAEPRCQYFSFSPTDQFCFLKSSNAGRRSNSNRISGKRTMYSCVAEEGYDYYGADLGSITVDSAEECCQACSSNSTCSYFTYETDGSQACLFKSSSAGRVARSNRISGQSTAGTNSSKVITQDNKTDTKGGDGSDDDDDVWIVSS